MACEGTRLLVAHQGEHASRDEHTGCRPQGPPEMPVEMGLVVETGLGSRLGGGVPVQEKPAGSVDAATDEVLMRGDAMGPGEDSAPVIIIVRPSIEGMSSAVYRYFTITRLCSGSSGERGPTK